MGKRPILVRQCRYFIILAQHNRRYKNRLPVDPEARCIGIDMNRYAVLNLSLKILTNGRSYDRNWVGFLI